MDARIAVIGAGYVGLPLAVAFAEAGTTVVCVEPDAPRVARINAGDSYIGDVPTEELGELVTRGLAARHHRLRRGRRLRRRDRVRADAADRRTASPTSRTSRAAAEAIAPHLQRGQLVVLESTTYPGTTREHPAADPGASRACEAGDGLPPRDVARAHRPGPHRLHRAHDAEGRRRPHAGLHRARRGAVPAGRRHAGAGLRRPRPPSSRSCSRTSSARSTSRFMNEMAMLCDRMGIDVWEVADAAGHEAVRLHDASSPGPGLGGHCLPLDPFYLVLAGPRVRLLHGVHRARRQGQREHAVLLPARRSRAP